MSDVKLDLFQHSFDLFGISEPFLTVSFGDDVILVSPDMKLEFDSEFILEKPILIDFNGPLDTSRFASSFDELLLRGPSEPILASNETPEVLDSEEEPSQPDCHVTEPLKHLRDPDTCKAQAAISQVSEEGDMNDPATLKAVYDAFEDDRIEIHFALSTLIIDRGNVFQMEPLEPAPKELLARVKKDLNDSYFAKQRKALLFYSVLQKVDADVAKVAARVILSEASSSVKAGAAMALMYVSVPDILKTFGKDSLKAMDVMGILLLKNPRSFWSGAFLNVIDRSSRLLTNADTDDQNLISLSEKVSKKAEEIVKKYQDQNPGP